MVIDYSEKRPGLERSKPPQKNRPRKEPMGMFGLMAAAVLIVTFGAGVMTGWLLFRGSGKAPAPAAVQPVKKEAAAPAATQPQPVPDAPLTFYKTLPAGGKAAMGSGLNPKKPEAPASAPQPAQPAPQEAASAPQGQAAPAQAPQDKDPASPRFTVQIASYRDKQEAEGAQAKLAAKGVAAYLVESRLPDKGVWYRLRVGKHLSKEEADQTAAKSGKGAMVLAE